MFNPALHQEAEVCLMMVKMFISLVMGCPCWTVPTTTFRQHQIWTSILGMFRCFLQMLIKLNITVFGTKASLQVFQYMALQYCLEQACSAYYVVWESWTKFGMHASHMKFNIQSEGSVNIYIILSVYLSIHHVQ